MNIFAPHTTDCYKLSHPFMYRKDMTFLYSNLTPRSDRLFKGGEGFDHKMVFLGLQGYIKEMLIENWNQSFFSQPKDEVIHKYARRMAGIFGPGVISTDHIAALHDLGYLPIMIMALPEGSRVNMGVPVLTVENTHPDFAWLVNYLETSLSAYVWKMSTTATIAFEYRRILEKYAKETGGSKEFIPLQAHDFSFRGMSGPEDSARSGLGHLVSFVGSDAVLALDYAEDYYGADSDQEMLAVSVPATEHSVSCSNILYIEKCLNEEGGYTIKMDDGVIIFCAEDKPEGWDNKLFAEMIFLEELITVKYPTGLISYVTDTFDFWGVLEHVLPRLKDAIMARKPDAIGLNKLVIRPDSGDPVEIICGKAPSRTFFSLPEAIEAINDEHFNQAAEDCEGAYNSGLDEYTTLVQVGEKFFELTTKFEYNRHDKTYYYIDNYGDAGTTVAKEVEPTPEMLGAIEWLWQVFGGTINDKGYRVLDEHIGLIYGDSITLERQEKILAGLKAKGFSSDNIVFGVGSYTYQHITRDTFGTAMKATACAVYSSDDGYETPESSIVELYKDPKTGASKKSARGFLRVEKEGNDFVLYVRQDTLAGFGAMRAVFSDGKLISEQSLADIRNMINEEIGNLA